MSQQCIEGPEMTDFLQGRIPEIRAEEIATHVDDCEICQETVAALSGSVDTFIAEFGGANSPPGMEQENAFRHGLQRLLSGMQRPSVGTTENPAPARIGPYWIEQQLGAGGMGCVYRAQHSKLKRTVALKVLPAHCLANTAAIARFEREMAAIGGLDHPNIVRASDAGEDAGMHYLVMEHVNGLDLGRMVKRLGQLPVADACELARQTAIGLQHAHDNGLVHRDVKPSNLMLAWEQTGGISADTKPTLKILDLGLALLGDEHRLEEQDMTTVGALMGTLDFMSPEQGIDSHAVDHRADIYGLGATLFKLLTGRAPYADPEYSTLMKKMTALATKAAPSVGLVRPDLPADVVNAVDRMLARDPDERFPSAREAAEALSAPATKANLAALLRRGTAAKEPGLDSPKASFSRLKPTTPAARPQPARSHGPGVGRWLIAIAIATGLALLVAGVAFYITTDRGTIRFESDDPNAKLIVKKGEAIVDRIELTQGKGKAVIRCGDYAIELDGEATGFTIEPAKVSVTRKGTIAVEIRQDAQPKSVRNITPYRFDGARSFAADLSVNNKRRLQPDVSYPITATFKNNGKQALTTFRVEFDVDQRLKIKSQNSTTPNIYPWAGRESLCWHGESLKPGESREITAMVEVPLDAPIESTRSVFRLVSDQGTAEVVAKADIVARSGDVVSDDNDYPGLLASNPRWQAFEPTKFEKALQGDALVLVFYNADWTARGKIYEHEVLDAPEVREFFDKRGIQLFFADVANRKGAAWETLRKSQEWPGLHVPELAVPFVAIHNPRQKYFAPLQVFGTRPVDEFIHLVDIATEPKRLAQRQKSAAKAAKAAE